MMDRAHSQKLVTLILKIPDIEDFSTRTDLLTGIPNRVSLARSQSNAQTDISHLISQLAPHSLSTGQWFVSILIENALARLEQTIAGEELTALHQQLLSSKISPGRLDHTPPVNASSGPSFHMNKTERYPLSMQKEEGIPAMEKIEIVIIAAPQDTKYCQQVISAIEGVLQFSEAKERVSIWHKGMIQPGSITAQEMWNHIHAAHLILLLMSQDLLANGFCKDPNNHMDAIIQRWKQGLVPIIPVLIRSCSWKHSPFKTLTPLPADGVPLASSSHKDGIIQNIAECVLIHIEPLMQSVSVEPTAEPAQPTVETPREKSAVFSSTPDTLFTSAKSSSTFVNGYALLIGVGGNLPVTAKDAEQLGRVLQHSARAAYSPSQITTLLDKDATRANILKAFDDLSQRIQHDPKATAIVYFSGHGGKFTRDGQPNEYFLIPYDYNAARRHETAIADHEFTAKIKAIHAQKLIVLLDCCHAGAIPMLKDVGEHFTKSSLPPELLQTLKSGKGRVVVTSSLENEQSEATALGSVFTNCLLEALRGKGTTRLDDAVRILSVLTYLFREVPLRASIPQHPFLNGISNLDEDFVICYAQVQKQDEPDVTITSHVPSIPTPHSTFQRSRLEKKRDELQASLRLFDEKIQHIRQAIAIENNVLLHFQYEKQLLQELQKRSSLEEELGAVLRQLET